jgi:hypothetical protein
MLFIYIIEILFELFYYYKYKLKNNFNTMFHAWNFIIIKKKIDLKINQLFISSIQNGRNNHRWYPI